MKKIKYLSAIVAIALGTASSAAFAINDSDANAGLKFNFTNPGARSLGMGGAFLALADDATAAYANPAGLSNLFRPEFSVEYRHTEFTTVFADTGRLLGEPSGLPGDDTNSIVEGESSESVDTLSFLSFVFPFEKFTVGAYRHQLADFESAYSAQGPITQDGRPQNGVTFLARVFPFQTMADLNIVNWGVSGSYRISDSLSLGLGVSYYDFEFDTATSRFNLPTGLENRGRPIDFTDAPFVRDEQFGDDNDIGFNVGLLWSLSERWSLGLVYRSGPEFEYEHTVVSLAQDPNAQATPPFPITDFDLPDVYGVGLAFRPSDQWAISFDINHITYSDITDGMVRAGSDNTLDFLSLDDGTEYRLGVEFVLATEHPVALRGGLWQEPDTRIAYNRVPTIIPDDLPNAERPAAFSELTRAALFLEGDEEIHYSFGAGTVIGRFQIDAAVDISDLTDTYSVSAVLFF